jgi:putative ABC transport system substrate-binding protein
MMGESASFSLGDHFGAFVEAKVAEGRYASASDVVRAGLRLLEEQEAARVRGLQIQVFNASTSREIDEAFAALARDRPDALFVAPDPLFTGRRVQIVTLTARDRIPAAYGNRDIVAAGGLMSCGTNIADGLRQARVYTGSILEGAKPADLPVVQATRFEFVINLQTARALGIEVPPQLLAITYEAID